MIIISQQGCSGILGPSHQLFDGLIGRRGQFEPPKQHLFYGRSDFFNKKGQKTGSFEKFEKNE